MIREPLDQSGGRLGVKHVGNVRELFRLFLDRAHDARISMAKTSYRKPAEKIEIAIAVGVIEIRAMPARKGQRQASVHIDHVLMREFYDLGVVHRILPPCALRAVSLSADTLARRCTTSVPIPERVKISSSTACLFLPSIMWVFATPLFSASMQHSTFGIIPS